MQVKLNLKIFVFILFFMFTNQIKIYLELMLFTFLHEMGHMLCGILLGLKPHKLEIMPVGFAILFKVHTKDYNKKILKTNLLVLKKLIIALTGPAVNLFFIFILNDTELIYINILIFLFNVVIIYPLDGGRILKYILCFFIKKSKVLYYVNIISNITVLFLILATIYLSLILKNISFIFAIVYIIGIAIKENKIYKIKRNMYRILENNIALNRD